MVQAECSAQSGAKQDPTHAGYWYYLCPVPTSELSCARTSFCEDSNLYLLLPLCTHVFTQQTLALCPSLVLGTKEPKLTKEDSVWLSELSLSVIWGLL